MSKDTVKKIKRPYRREKILANHLFEKGQIYIKNS